MPGDSQWRWLPAAMVLLAIVGAASGLVGGPTREVGTAGSSASIGTPTPTTPEPTSSSGFPTREEATVDASTTSASATSTSGPGSTTPRASTPPPDNGDLGVPGHPISEPPCTGGYALFVGAAVTPGRYVEDLTTLLAANPGSRYLRNPAGCTSLRHRTAEGNQIYGVYYGLYASSNEALADCYRAATPDAYVKPLDTVSDPGSFVTCSSN